MSEFIDFELNVDLSSPDIIAFNGEGSAPKLPIGDFIFQITNVEQHTSKAGNACLKVTSAVAEGEYTGITMERIYALTPAALGFLKQLAISIGANLSPIRGSEFVGKYYAASIKHETQPDWVNTQGETKQGGVKAELYNVRIAPEVEGVAPAAAPAAAPKAAHKAATAPTPAARAAVTKAVGTAPAARR